MGNPVGVNPEKDVKDLSKDDREMLKQHVMHQIQTSAEIHKIISADPKLLKTLTKHRKINSILRRKAKPMLARLKKR
jgi:hypothetical protein